MTKRAKVAAEGSSGLGPDVDGPAPLEEVTISISDLGFGPSPRLVPEDVDHARMLAEVSEPLPPILVHAETMAVIDGRHRVLAARFRGSTSIRALLFRGTEEAAYLAGVRANTSHGKPLTLAERLAAARHILSSTPQLSDRSIARICGLSPRTVGAHRKSSSQGVASKRLGEDGRKHPLNSHVARQHAAELMIAFPNDSNRSIGRRVGISEGTVRAVRRQLGRDTDALSTNPAPVRSTASGHPRERPTSSSGLQFSAWLVAHAISEASWTDLVADLPLSECPGLIVTVRSISESWGALVARLELRVRGDDS